MSSGMSRNGTSSQRRVGTVLVLGTAIISGVSIYINRFAVFGGPG